MSILILGYKPAWLAFTSSMARYHHHSSSTALAHVERPLNNWNATVPLLVLLGPGLRKQKEAVGTQEVMVLGWTIAGCLPSGCRDKMRAWEMGQAYSADPAMCWLFKTRKTKAVSISHVQFQCGQYLLATGWKAYIGNWKKKSLPLARSSLHIRTVCFQSKFLQKKIGQREAKEKRLQKEDKNKETTYTRHGSWKMLPTQSLLCSITHFIIYSPGLSHGLPCHSPR